MTGFGVAVCKEEHVSVSVELKTVNNRYFKLSLKLTEGYSALEPRIESLLRSVIERGTVNAHIRIIGTREEIGYQINTAVLQSYAKQLSDAAAALRKEKVCGFFLPFSLEQCALLPGVIGTERENHDVDNETIWSLLEKTIREALDALQTMRKAEGASMEKDLTANVESLRQWIGNIMEMAPRTAPLYRQKLKERIEKAMEEQSVVLGDADFVRELAVYADRCDVSEELVRFQSHLEQFTSAMQSRESCGRKLDFLTQELFREVNTIGSKANDADITKYVVEIKTGIERIREMVQNVE
jgi:uncharacterized protein (TIGR00255 family)